MAKGGSKIAKTPSGITFAQYMKMSEGQKLQTLRSILSDNSITVPNYLDDSATTKVIYALGMDNKPVVVSDSAFDNIPGVEMFRTVRDTNSPPPYATDILDQVRYGDYTQMSGIGGSVFGRALYFATDFGDSQVYGHGRPSATMARAKIDPKAKIITDTTLDNRMSKNSAWMNLPNSSYDDGKALYALSHGIDGWREPRGGTYRMIVNRGAIIMSDTSKDVSSYSTRGWASAPTR